MRTTRQNESSDDNAEPHIHQSWGQTHFHSLESTIWFQFTVRWVCRIFNDCLPFFYNNAHHGYLVWDEWNRLHPPSPPPRPSEPVTKIHSGWEIWRSKCQRTFLWEIHGRKMEKWVFYCLSERLNLPSSSKRWLWICSCVHICQQRSTGEWPQWTWWKGKAAASASPSPEGLTRMASPECQTYGQVG